MPSSGNHYKLTVGSIEASSEAPNGVEAVMVEDHVDLISVAEVTFNASGEAQWANIQMGADVKITMGGSNDQVFQGYVTEMRYTWTQGVRTLTVQAMDPLCKLAATRSTKVWENKQGVGDDTIVGDVIGQAGLTKGTIDTGAKAKYTLQRNESHLYFLKRLAARNGYLLLATPEGKIDFKKPQYSGEAKVKLPLEEAKYVEYGLASTTLPDQVKVFGWDYVAKEKVEGLGSEIDSIGSGSAAHSSSGRIWTGPAIVADVFVDNQDGANAMAKGELNRLARTYLRGRAVIEGNATVRAGQKLKFEGSKKGFNPEVFVISTRHAIDTTGYWSTITFVGNTLPT